MATAGPTKVNPMPQFGRIILPFLLSLAVGACGGNDIGEGPGGQLTSGIGGACTSTANCDSGLACVDGTCAMQMSGNECSAASPCPEGMACEAGRCTMITGGGCTSDDECPGICSGGACVAALCTDDASCGAAGMCTGGRCVASSECDLPPIPGAACERCETGCNMDPIAGEEEPFDLDEDEAEGVGLEEGTGDVILETSTVNTHFIWIANTGEGTVAKVDTRTYEEVARYFTGPAGTGNDPSRTTVNLLGDVYVANRRGNSVTKISTLGAECPDTNGDGVVTTSSGAGDILPWGTDDCVLWNVPLGNSSQLLRAAAAQDDFDPEGDIISSVWIGSYPGRKVWQLDGDTGAVLVDATSPFDNYGFALGPGGILWSSARAQRAVGRIDTNACTTAAGCPESAFTSIPTPGNVTTYGITVDGAGRVWTANHGGNNATAYDPATGAWTTANIGVNCHGVVADADGWIYCAAHGAGVIRIEAANPANHAVVMGTTGVTNKGMALDADGKIWSITQSDAAVVIEPGAGMGLETVNPRAVTGLISPYTYSDMTGGSVRLATNPRGQYRKIFEGCEGDNAETAWKRMAFDVGTPDGTSVLFRIRSAQTLDALDDEDWTFVTEMPGGMESPVAIAALLDGTVSGHGRYLQVEAQLISERRDPMMPVTPRLRALSASHGACDDIPE